MSHGIEEYAAPSSESMAGPKQRQLVILFAGKLFRFFYIFFDLMLAEEKLVRDHIYSILASLHCWKDLSYQDPPAVEPAPCPGCKPPYLRKLIVRNYIYRETLTYFSHIL